MKKLKNIMFCALMLIVSALLFVPENSHTIDYPNSDEITITVSDQISSDQVITSLEIGDLHQSAENIAFTAENHPIQSNMNTLPGIKDEQISIEYFSESGFLQLPISNNYILFRSHYT